MRLVYALLAAHALQYLREETNEISEASSIFVFIGFDLEYSSDTIEVVELLEEL